MRTSEREWTIAIQLPDNRQIRKITKIVSLSDGGFSIVAPYHSARKGFLCKMPVDPSKRGVYEMAPTTSFAATDRVKLSYHSDGFVQFSGENAGRIKSGIDKITGEPKGLGLFTNPLTSPIWTGSSVGVTVWGLEEFDEANRNERLLLFKPDDLYYRNCTPETANAWKISIFVFPWQVVPPVRFREGQQLLNVAAEPASGNILSVIEMKVMRLRHHDVCLGAYVNAMSAAFPAKSGWILNGPGDYALGRRGHVLMALYPSESLSSIGHPSLDRDPSSSLASQP